MSGNGQIARRYISLTKAAAEFDCTPEEIMDLITAGEVDGFQNGSLWFVDEVSLEDCKAGVCHERDLFSNPVFADMARQDRALDTSVTDTGNRDDRPLTYTQSDEDLFPVLDEPKTALGINADNEDFVVTADVPGDISKLQADDSASLSHHLKKAAVGVVAVLSLFVATSPLWRGESLGELARGVNNSFLAASVGGVMDTLHGGAIQESLSDQGSWQAEEETTPPIANENSEPEIDIESYAPQPHLIVMPSRGSEELDALLTEQVMSDLSGGFDLEEYDDSQYKWGKLLPTTGEGKYVYILVD